MPKLEDLIEPLDELDEDTLRLRLREIREDRRISKHTSKPSKAVGERKADKIRKGFADLSEEEKAELIAAIQEGGG